MSHTYGLAFALLLKFEGRRVADGKSKRNVMANDQINGREADNTVAVASFSCQW